MADLSNDVTDLLDRAEGTPAATKAPAAWSEFLKRRLGGPLRLDPAKVVAKTAPEMPPVAPGGAGVAELVDSGAIAPIGEIEAFNAADEKVRQECIASFQIGPPGSPRAGGLERVCPAGHPDNYEIKRQIELPLGLDRTLYRFVLPPESGSLANVVWQDTGEFVFPPPLRPRIPDFHDPTMTLPQPQ